MRRGGCEEGSCWSQAGRNTPPPPPPPRAHTLFTIVFFSFSYVGRGNECTVAAALTEILSEGDDNHKQVSASLQKMVNKTKVRDFNV